MRRPGYKWVAVTYYILSGLWLLLSLLGGNIIIYETTDDHPHYYLGSLFNSYLFYFLLVLTIVYCIIKAVIKEEGKDNITLDAVYELTRKFREKLQMAISSGNMENANEIEAAVRAREELISRTPEMKNGPK